MSLRRRVAAFARRAIVAAAAALAVPACAPPPPELSASLTSASRVDLSWTSVRVTRFTVERSSDGVSFELLAELPGNAARYTDTTVGGGVTYYYRVGGWYDEVAYSNVVVVTTPWAIAYGGEVVEDFLAVAVSPDGGFLAAGDADVAGTRQWDGWLVRMRPDGAILWQKSIGTALGEWIDHVEPTGDGGFILVGECGWYWGGGDGWVVRLDAEGNVPWQYSLGGEDFDELLGVAQTPDGGFILAGYTYSAGAGGSDLWLVRMSAAGGVLWQRAYGGPFYEGLSYTLQVRPTSDGGFVVASAGGGPDPYGMDGSDIWVLKVDSGGNPLWARSYGGPGVELGFCVRETANGQYLIAGTTTSFGAGGTDFWILRLNESGAPVWQRAIGGPGEDWAYWIEEASSGDVLVAGTTDSFGAGAMDWWVMRLRSNGRAIWQRTYGGPDDDWVYAMQCRETPDGGLVAGGSTRSGLAAGWVLKLAGDGTVSFDPSSGYAMGVTSAREARTNVRPVNVPVETRIPDFVPVPYPALAAETDIGAVRQAP